MLSIDPLPAPDPADANMIAYAEDIQCSPTCLFDVHVGNRAGTIDRVVVGDDAPFASLAWTPDGAALIDVEAGTQAGIWTYAATATTPAKKFTWLLADPSPSPSHPYWTTIGQARYMAPGKVLFSQSPDFNELHGDLYTIPLSVCAQRASATTAGCTMADAHRLTSQGDNAMAVWTGATKPLLGHGQKLTLILTAAHDQSVTRQGGLTATVTCSIQCALRASGSVKIAKRLYKTQTMTTTLSAGRATGFTLKLTTASLKAIRSALAAHKHSVAEIDIQANPGNGTTTKTLTFTLAR